MPRDSNAIYQDEPFAETGDITTPPGHGINLAAGYDVSYEQVGGNRPPRQVFNWFWRLLTSLAREVNQRGLLEWNNTIDYEHPAAVLGSNGTIYTSRSDSGPGSGGAVDPVGLTGSTRWRSASGTTPPNATTGQRGIVELAENSEVRTGSDTSRAVTPAGLSSRTATTTRTGILSLATTSLADAGTNTTTIMTPALVTRVVGLGPTPPNATIGQRGIVELAEDSEVRTGTDSERAVTPAGLSSRTATTTRTGILSLATTSLADAGTNTTTAITPALLARIVASVTGGSVPVGTLIDYGGVSAPTGFLVCNGSLVSRTTYATLFSAIGTVWGAGNGSTTFAIPNLQGRFSIGSDSSRAVGDLGGTENVALTSGQMPSHSHSDGSLTTTTVGSHTHGDGSLTATTVGSHTHGDGSYTAAQVPAHSHSITINAGGNAGARYILRNVGTSTTSTSTGSAGAHGHSISGSSGLAGSHGHGVSGSTGSAGGHDHGVSGSTGSAGSNQSHTNVPPFAAVLVCIKT